MTAVAKRLCALFWTIALCGAILGGCSPAPQAPDGEAGGDPQAQTFLASDLGVKSDTELSFPFLGLKLKVPERLGRRMDSGEVMCQASEHTDGGAIAYAYLWWDVVPAENRDAEFPVDEDLGASLDTWLAALQRVGTIGVFRRDLEDQLSALTGGDTHTVLGSNEAYQYVLSLRSGADEAIAEELRQTAADIEITEMVPFNGESAFDMPRTEVTSLGAFSTETVAGETVTQELFQPCKLTLVNLFATWCTPCVQEIPELEALSQAMAERGVQVIGVVLDARDSAGAPDAQAIEKAKVLQERTGASYPFLIPDAGLMNGRLAGVTAVPETFFVDENGAIVGETYVGARDLAAWTGIVEKELAALEGGA